MLTPQEILDSLSSEDVDVVLKSINARKGEQLTAELIEQIITPNFIGPVWKKDESGEWILPGLTLGWEVAGWCTKWLRDPNDSSKPWIFTDEQLRFVLWWYAIDETGEWVYNKGVLQRRKGWGKDPLLAALSIAEMVGPVRFSHFDKDGQPVAKRCHAALAQVTAVVQSQTTNTSDMFKLMMSNELIAQYGITPGIEIIRALGGTSQTQMVTSSYRAIEGKRATFTLLNEALALTTPIPTPSGWVSMGDITDGDVIYGSRGQRVRVLKAHDVQYGRKCYRVTFDDGNSIVASDGHWWKVRRANNRNCPIVEMTTDEMFSRGGKFYLPESFESIECDDRDLPIDPYVLGLWLGDGSSDHGVIACDSKDLLETVKLLESRGEACSIRDDNHIALTTAINGVGWTHAGSFKGRLRREGLLRNKHIPKEYMRASFGQRLDLLRGLMDSDGSVRRGGNARFANVDANLLEQVRELLVSLGYHVKLPKFQVRKESFASNWSPCGSISFKAVPEVNPFLLERKASIVSGRSVTRSRLRSIVDISEVESVPVRCITVDAEDRLFLAGRGFHPTRNTHHWVASNGGLKLYQTINGNAAKLGNRYLAITNAYVPGDGGVDAGGSEAEQGSVAEKMREAWQAEEDGRAVKTGFFYDSVEASARAPLSGPLVPHIVERMIGDSKWTKVRDVISSINDLSMPAERSRRMWYNQVVADTESLYTPEIIAAAQVEDAELRRGDQIVLGLDGGLTDDSTALVAIRTTDKTVFVLGCWGRWEDDGHEGYIVDQERVSDVIDIAHDMYDVVGFISDVEHWETYVNRWTELYAETYRVKAKGVDSIKLDMRGNKERLTRANESLIAAIMGKDLRLDTDTRLKRHLMNVRRRENKWGVGFGKESRESRKKVDIYAALLLAYEALVLFKTRPIDKKPEYGTTGYFF